MIPCRQPNQNREPSENRGKWLQLVAGSIIVSVGVKQKLYLPTVLLVELHRMVHEKKAESLFFVSKYEQSCCGGEIQFQ